MAGITSSGPPTPSTSPDSTNLQTHRKNYSDELKRITPFLGVRDVAACTAYVDWATFQVDFTSRWSETRDELFHKYRELKFTPTMNAFAHRSKFEMYSRALGYNADPNRVLDHQQR